MTQRVSKPGWTGVFLGGIAVVMLSVPCSGWAQAVRPPTPRESIARTMAPVTEALDALTATPAEREAMADLLARAESAAAARVEADHHRDPNAAEASGRRIARVIEALRARVAALRAEAQATEAESAALAAERALATQQGALDRASTRHMLTERPTPEPAPPATPAPPASPAPAATPVPAAPRATP